MPMGAVLKILGEMNLLPLGQLGMNPLGGRNGNQTKREDNTGDDEQRIALHVAETEQLLTDADTQVAQNHIDGKNPGPVLGFGAFIPASSR